jgi:linoleoyl-CoA desaturase
LSVAKEHPEKALRFSKQYGFRKTLNEQVNAHLKTLALPARDVPAMYVKTAIVFAWWMVAYLLILLGGFPPLVNLALCLMWGVAIASIGFNVMHDANHGGYSARPWVNKLFSLSAEFLGISGFRWRVKHNIWHHTYTNIAGMDDDIETMGTMRLSPHEPWKPMYRFQHWYFPVIYSFIAFDFIIRDFMMIFTGKSDDKHVYPKLNWRDKVVFWGGKAFFFTIMLILPMLVFPWWQVIVGVVVVLLTVGLLTGLVFQLAHIMEAAQFPEPVGDPLHIENEWAIHEVETTVNFAPNNRLLNWYIGGLNYQVEHHLLPHICHLHYPTLAPIVQKTCESFGVKYHSYPTWRQAFMSHWRALRQLGRQSEQDLKRVQPITRTTPAK